MPPTRCRNRGRPARSVQSPLRPWSCRRHQPPLRSSVRRPRRVRQARLSRRLRWTTVRLALRQKRMPWMLRIRRLARSVSLRRRRPPSRLSEPLAQISSVACSTTPVSSIVCEAPVPPTVTMMATMTSMLAAGCSRKRRRSCSSLRRAKRSCVRPGRSAMPSRRSARSRSANWSCLVTSNSSSVLFCHVAQSLWRICGLQPAKTVTSRAQETRSVAIVRRPGRLRIRGPWMTS
mmetsp:Transcript_5959/g.21239  ORF Transcript_5959/g.21239 Transcript_5959/m.21239 type:complete len:233 (-) Transcript_5959:54-752(-)